MEAPYTCVRLHPDGVLLGTGTAENVCRIWEIRQATVRAAITGVVSWSMVIHMGVVLYRLCTPHVPLETEAHNDTDGNARTVQYRSSRECSVECK